MAWPRQATCGPLHVRGVRRSAVALVGELDVSGFSPRMQVILVAMQRYGMILADNGSPWFFSGVSDIRWDDDELNQLKSLRGSDFEVVDTTGLVNGP